MIIIPLVLCLFVCLSSINKYHVFGCFCRVGFVSFFLSSELTMCSHLFSTISDQFLFLCFIRNFGLKKDFFDKFFSSNFFLFLPIFWWKLGREKIGNATDGERNSDGTPIFFRVS